jgi:dihydroxyacetone kinase-like protein
MVSRDDVLAWVKALAAIYNENRQYLTDLDSPIGDADHGVNLDRGFKAVMGKLDGVADQDIGSILKMVGMTLVSTVGGAGGPLYGTLFMKAGMVCKDKMELGPADVVALFESALEGVVQRGKAKPGEKTMVDALTPAVAALRGAVENGSDLKEAMKQAAAAAEQGMKDTIPMKALKGRASYLGERSIGHQDPGATSSYLLVQAAADLWG